MSKPVKSIYRFLAWLFSVVIAAGVLTGCGESTKYGSPVAKYGLPPKEYAPQETKYGPPSPKAYQNKIKGNNVS